MQRFDGKRVLFAQRSANRDGSAISGLISVKALLSAGCDVTVVFGHAGPMLEDYREMGAKVEIFPHGDWLRAGALIRSCRRVSKECRLAKSLGRRFADRHFNLVYVNSLVSMCFARYASLQRIPCVWHIRELFSDVGGEMVVPAFGGKWLVRFLIDRSSREVVTNSIAVGKNVLGDKLRQRAKVIYNSSSFDSEDSQGNLLSLRTRFDLGDEATVVGVPSTMRPMKGQDLFIKTLPRIIEQFPAVAIVLLGNYESGFGLKVRHLVDKLGLQQHVFLAGELSDMKTFYSSCDVVCIPSRAEPFGRVAIEAMLAGCAVMASRVGGLREIISHEVDGLLFDVENEDSICNCFASLASDKSFRLQLSQKARAKAARQFSPERYCRESLDVCARAMSGS